MVDCRRGAIRRSRSESPRLSKWGLRSQGSGSAEGAVCFMVPPEADSEMKSIVVLWKYDVKLQQLVPPLMIADGIAASAPHHWALNICLQEYNWVRLSL